MSPCLLHRRISQRSLLASYSLWNFVLSQDPGGWTITIPLPRPQFLPTALSHFPLHPGTLLPLSEENIWLLLLECMRTWDEDDSETGQNWNTNCFLCSREDKQKARPISIFILPICSFSVPTLAELIMKLPMNHHQVSYGVIPSNEKESFSSKLHIKDFLGSPGG